MLIFSPIEITRLGGYRWKICCWSVYAFALLRASPSTVEYLNSSFLGSFLILSGGEYNGRFVERHAWFEFGEDVRGGGLEEMSWSCGMVFL